MLRIKVLDDYKNAMKARNVIEKSILWYVVSQIKMKEKDENKELDDWEIIKLLKKEVKSREEAISFLIKADKNVDIQIENEKKHILEKYITQYDIWIRDLNYYWLIH